MTGRYAAVPICGMTGRYAAVPISGYERLQFSAVSE
jgi:hypothetical protein